PIERGQRIRSFHGTRSLRREPLPRHGAAQGCTGRRPAGGDRCRLGLRREIDRGPPAAVPPSTLPHAPVARRESPPKMTALPALPRLIQGGMGVGVSNWRLAAAVTGCGQLGVVSGTGLDTLFIRRLQDGDLGGHLRRAMAHFPLPEVVARVLEKFHRPEGKRPEVPYRPLARYDLTVDKLRPQITVLANFVEVWLAREQGRGPVGINLLTKIQMPNLASL